jgi:hypothetical protein
MAAPERTVARSIADDNISWPETANEIIPTPPESIGDFINLDERLANMTDSVP